MAEKGAKFCMWMWEVKNHPMLPKFTSECGLEALNELEASNNAHLSMKLSHRVDKITQGDKTIRCSYDSLVGVN